MKSGLGWVFSVFITFDQVTSLVLRFFFGPKYLFIFIKVVLPKEANYHLNPMRSSGEKHMGVLLSSSWTRWCDFLRLISSSSEVIQKVVFPEIGTFFGCFLFIEKKLTNDYLSKKLVVGS